MVYNNYGLFGNRGHVVPRVSLWPLDVEAIVPRIHPELLDAVFYLYPSKEAAQNGESAGGTGVFVGVSIPEIAGASAIYACSNKHVVGSDGCSVVRINSIEGGVAIFEYDPAQWTYDPRHDLAAVNIPIHPSFRLRHLPLEMFITEEEIRDQDAIGPGEEVFMTGRFVNHDGKLVNVPSVRFGHLSMMPLSIRHPGGYDQESFAVEMLSRPGYSGSPVYVYRSPFDLRTGSLTAGVLYMKFLGLNWGFIADPAEVKEELRAVQQTASGTQKTVRYISTNTGMNGVVPAWHLRSLLETGPILKERQVGIADHLAKQRILEPRAELASVPPASDVNPTHREDFTRLLGAAVKKPAQED